MRTIDLFSGCGGLSKGFEYAGFNIVRAYDNWQLAVDCYNLNFDHSAEMVDLSNPNEVIDRIKSIGNIDVVIGGPPCQDFSHAGKRMEGKRASLTGSFAEIVSAVNPEVYVMENVDRALKSNSYQEASKLLKKSGFKIKEIVLDASRCGVPQKRKRLFSIGYKGEVLDSILSVFDEKMSEEPLTLRDFFGEGLNFEFYYRHPRNYSRRGVFSVDEPAPTIRGVNRPVPKGYPGHHGDPVPVTEELRSLTTFERSRIQTFPTDFVWVGSKTQVEQMIGNAVPVLLGKFVADAIMELKLTECKLEEELV